MCLYGNTLQTDQREIPLYKTWLKEYNFKRYTSQLHSWKKKFKRDTNFTCTYFYSSMVGTKPTETGK